MFIELNPLQLFTHKTAKAKFNNNYKILFGNTNDTDSFQNSSIENLFDEKRIKALIYNNEELKKILKDNKLENKLNMTELIALKQGHCRDCSEICARIYKALPVSIKRQVSLKNLKDAAMLHDFGKVLIPSEILNKQDKLSDDEYKIMHLHSEIGYQLLKKADINDEVLNLVRYHHDNVVNKNFVPNINLQILNLADKYSALAENRIYKRALTPKEALTVIYSDVQKGNVHPFLFKALVEALRLKQNPQTTSALSIK